MNTIQIIAAVAAFFVLIFALYAHIGWTNIRECYGMWFRREYWTDYNTVEFLSWASSR